MLRGKSQFITGFALGALLCGSVVVFSASRVYVESNDGAWIRDAGVYTSQTDQINVLGDIAPGGGVMMQEIAIRLNALNAAGKKQNWDFASYQVVEMTEAIEKLIITRPALETDLDNFLTTSVTPVNDAITAQDKSAFKSAIRSMADGCTSCHQTVGSPFLEVKIGKSILPIR